MSTNFENPQNITSTTTTNNPIEESTVGITCGREEASAEPDERDYRDYTTNEEILPPDNQNLHDWTDDQ